MADSTREPVLVPQDLAISLLPRVLRNVLICPTKGCWLRASSGYTTLGFELEGRRRYAQAHRIAYVAVNGPIPEGLTIDHLCNEPPCCNPLHLKAVTLRENVLRSETNPCAIYARRTHCANGHPLPPPTGKAGRPRGCKICQARARRERYYRKKAERLAAEADA